MVIVCGYCNALPRLSIAQESDPTYLKYARQVANWLDSVAVKNDHGIQWPTVPSKSEDSNDFLYSGNSGVVLFYLYMYRSTGDQQYLDQAVAGANSLAENVKVIGNDSNASFWSGIAGIGYTLDLMFEATKSDRFRQAGKNCFEHIRNSARQISETNRPAVRWNDVTDIIGGSAGIGFYLIDYYKRTGDLDAFDFAVKAGDGLLFSAKSTSAGRQEVLKWMMSPTFPREMPNYSHGTAGVCDFLVVLDLYCRLRQKTDRDFAYDGRFQKAAIKGAEYLASLHRKTYGLIPHHFPEEKPLYYLGWCHGPAGTTKLFDRLAETTNNRRWDQISKKLIGRVMSSGIPEKRPDGFWNNVGVCCGNAGVASCLIDRYDAERDLNILEFAQRMTDDLLSKATTVQLEDGKTGVYWTHAEHRVRPDFLEAQTGLMQGAAGIGLLLLKMDSTQRNSKLRFALPVSPF